MTKVVSIFLSFSIKLVVINFSSVNILLIVLCGFIKVDSWIYVLTIVVNIISHTLYSKLNSQQLKALSLFIINSLWQMNIMLFVFLNSSENILSYLKLNKLIYIILSLLENALL